MKADDHKFDLLYVKVTDETEIKSFIRSSDLLRMEPLKFGKLCWFNHQLNLRFDFQLNWLYSEN